MDTSDVRENYADTTITYAIEVDGRFYLIENVPARVCVETGEQLFSPERMARLQQFVWENAKPVRVVETPVLDFAT